ncbi:uncharacterized protein LOC144926497 isoform X2 [Branchiostoma floridae x Branchiostoma belcheri]
MSTVCDVSLSLSAVWNNNVPLTTFPCSSSSQTDAMWENIINILSCCALIKTNKVTPTGEGVYDGRKESPEPQDMSMDRGNDVFLVQVAQAPLSQARSTKSSDDVLADLRQAGVIPIKCQPTSVAFEVADPKTASANNAPPRRPVKLEKLDRKMEERREMVKKRIAETPNELRTQLNEADERRRDILAKRSRKLANQAARKAGKKPCDAKSTAFFIKPTMSELDVITTRESKKRRRMEARMEKRRARVAKKATVEALEARQADAAERRQEKVRATVDKAKRFGRPASPVWMEPAGRPASPVWMEPAGRPASPVWMEPAGRPASPVWMEPAGKLGKEERRETHEKGE